MKKAIFVFSFLFSINLILGASLKDQIAALVKDAPDPGEEGLKKKLPAKVSSTQLAYYGIYALMKFHDSKRLGIFNIAQNKFQQMIPVKSDKYLLAAGADIMLIYYTDIKILEIWNLTTMKKAQVKKLNMESGFITNIAMGAALKSKALISGSVGDGALDRRFYGTLDLRTFKITVFEQNGRVFRNSSYRDRVHLRPNYDMTGVVSWCTSHSPTGFVHVSIGDKVTGSYIHSSFRSLNYTNNTNIVVTGAGQVTNSRGHVLKAHSNSMCFPVLGGDFYLQYVRPERSSNGGKILVRGLNSHSVVREFQSPVALHSVQYSYRDMPLMTEDRHVLASKLSD